MHLLALQFDIAWKAPKDNLLNVTAMLGADALPAGALIVLPEMFATGFSMNADLSLAAQAETEALLAELARQLDAHVLGGLVRRTDAGPANQVAWFNRQGELCGTFSKLHPFSPRGEGEHYTAGQEVAVWEIDGAKVAPLICYDLRFPESFRRAIERGAEIFCVPGNWPAGRKDHWRTLLGARAVENQACVVGVNRVGSDPHVEYAGGSLILGPRGEPLAEAGAGPEALTADVDLDELRQYRQEFPALTDRRDDGL